MVPQLPSSRVLAGFWWLLITGQLVSLSQDFCLGVHAAKGLGNSSLLTSQHSVSADGAAGQEQEQQLQQQQPGMESGIDYSVDPKAEIDVGAAHKSSAASGAGSMVHARGDKNRSVKRALLLAAAIALLLGVAMVGSKVLKRVREPKVKGKLLFLENIRLMIDRAKGLADAVGTERAMDRYKEVNEYMATVREMVKEDLETASEEDLYKKAEGDLLKGVASLVELQDEARAEGERLLQQTKYVIMTERWPDTMWEIAVQNDFLKAGMRMLKFYEEASRKAVTVAKNIIQSLGETPNLESMEHHRYLEVMTMDMERLREIQTMSTVMVDMHARLQTSMTGTLRMIAVEDREEMFLTTGVQVDMLKAIFADMAEWLDNNVKTKEKLSQMMSMLQESLVKLEDLVEQQIEATKPLKSCDTPREVEQRTIYAVSIEKEIEAVLESVWATIRTVGRYKEVGMAPFPKLHEALASRLKQVNQEVADSKAHLRQRIEDLERRMTSTSDDGGMMAPTIYLRTLKALKELVHIDQEASEVPEQELHLPVLTRKKELRSAEEDTQAAVASALHMRRVHSECDLIETEFEVYEQLVQDIKVSQQIMERDDAYIFFPESYEDMQAKKLKEEFKRLSSRIPRIRRQALLADVASNMRSLAIELESHVYRDERAKITL
ncbi:hypothetical protein ACSSS7_004712 [Eimeria intestinalis]